MVIVRARWSLIGLMQDIHKPIFLSAVERYGSLLFFVISAAIMARLLTPEEFGVYAIIIAFTGVIVAYFHEFGGANYLIQKKELSNHNIRTAFTITFLTSLLVALIFLALRDAAATFFSHDGMRIGIAVCALNLLLTPFSATITALLRRDMAFDALARCNLAANFSNSLSSIVFALFGYSFMAPILGMIVGSVVLNVLLLGYHRDLRIFKPSLRDYREVVSFGAYSSSVVLINVFYQWSPQLILGRVLDFSAVGLYSRAINITQMFDRLVIQVLNPVVMPAIFLHIRSGGDLRKVYLDTLELISALQWPFLIYFAMMADTLIVLWLGPTWVEIVPLVQLLCIASLALFAAFLTYPVLVAVGRVKDTLTASLISLPPSLLLTFVAAFFGVKAVAASMLVAFPFQAAVAFYFIGRHLKFGAMDIVRATAKSFVITVICAGGVLLSITIAHYQGMHPIVGLLLSAVMMPVAWGLALVLTDHPLLAQIMIVVRRLSFARSASFR